MAKEKAIYAPGELDKVKNRLGPIDESEARRMQKVLGGEVARERTTDEDEAAKRPRAAGAGGAGQKKGRSIRSVAVAEDEKEQAKKPRSGGGTWQIGAVSYFERVKMDECCADAQFGIKTSLQVLVSKLCFFKTPKDKISTYFVKNTIDEYYKHLEALVTAARIVFPKSNAERNAKFKKASAFYFIVLDMIRRWSLGNISREIAAVQTHPRMAFAEDFIDIIREIYRPLMILDNITTVHVDTAFETLYKVIFIDAPTAETEKLRAEIAKACAAYQYITQNIKRLLYPLLMKFTSTVFFPCEEFFADNRENILRFLGLNEDSILKAPGGKRSAGITEDGMKAADEAAARTLAEDEDEKKKTVAEEAEKEVEEEKSKAEKKVVDKGLQNLMHFFPESDLDRGGGADLYPYFAGALDLKKGSEIISPLDPAQFALVLSHIIEEFLMGFRSIKFDEPFEHDEIAPILENWDKTIDDTFYNNYLLRITEYGKLFQNSAEHAKSAYGMGLLNDIHWVRRYYLFPHYDYKSGVPPTFQRKEVNPLYAIARNLRRALTSLASNIETANKAGGAKEDVKCQDIANPWDAYIFEVANPVSKRMNYLLSKPKRTNVSLIYFTLAACSVLDDFLNNPQSAAYSADKDVVFRSVNNAGKEPVLWVDKQNDTFDIFKRHIEAAQAAARKGNA